MRHLTTVRGTFHGRVLVARLGAAGVLAELRGALDGPYPFQVAVDVLVAEDDLETAREILLADAVDAAVDDEAIEAQFTADGFGEEGLLERQLSLQPHRIDRLGTLVAIALVVALIVVGLAATAR